MSTNSKFNFAFVLTASILVLVVFYAVGGLFFSSRSLTQEILPSRIIDVQGAILPILQNNWKLSGKIEEGKELLKNSPPLRFEEAPQKDKRGRIIKKNGQPVMEMVRKEIAIAILDTETGDVFEKRYWLDMDEINKASDLRKKYLDNPDHLPKFEHDNVNEEFGIVSNWWNSFNSDLSVVKDGVVNDRYVVIPNKYLMTNDSLTYLEDRTGAKYSDIVYVPYSPALRDRAIIVAGKQFLSDHVQEAFEELTVAGVQSRAFPGKLVTDTMTQTFVKNIFITEQTDPKMILLSTDGGLGLAERVLVRLGTNGEKAFRYTVSKTGASGLGQIMPGTYQSIVKRYPTVQLIQNTDIGRVDIKNAIKVSILVFDDHLATVVNRANSSTKAKQIFSKKTQDEIDEIRAAIYNGGPSKYKHLTGNISTAVTETVLFVKKFQMIRELNLFN